MSYERAIYGWMGLSYLGLLIVGALLFYHP